MLARTISSMRASTPHSPVTQSSPAGDAQRLADDLADLGITADVHDGYGLALVSVWVGLVVWCDGERFWWRSGWDPHRRIPVYAWHLAYDTERAARRVARQFADLRQTHPLSAMIAEITTTPEGGQR